MHAGGNVLNFSLTGSFAMLDVCCRTSPQHDSEVFQGSFSTPAYTQWQVAIFVKLGNTDFSSGFYDCLQNTKQPKQQY